MIASLLVLALGATATTQDGAATVSLFDGQRLDNWNGDPRFWSVEDGQIVGRSTTGTPCEESNYLVFEGAEFADFDLGEQCAHITFVCVDRRSHAELAESLASEVPARNPRCTQANKQLRVRKVVRTDDAGRVPQRNSDLELISGKRCWFEGISGADNRLHGHDIC